MLIAARATRQTSVRSFPLSGAVGVVGVGVMGLSVVGAREPVGGILYPSGGHSCDEC
jgi:hypothetical protein